MIDIHSILDPRCTRASVEANSRKRSLEYASDVLAACHPDLSARTLFDELMTRERLGSTGLGEGIAIPHCRLPCPGILAACLKLDTPVDYDAADGQPVDILFVIVVPPEETNAHLDLLAALARLFNNPENRAALRSAETDAALYDRIVGLFSSQAA
ncbi:MAG: PTS sugar transporter subunit IIA [Pseudomonadales bacterium]